MLKNGPIMIICSLNLLEIWFSSRSIVVIEIYICRWRQLNIFCEKPTVPNSIMDTLNSYLRSILMFVRMNTKSW